ncbi:MAG: hypothetical protein ACOY4Q_02460 [Bacillota bacterium]
MKTDSGAMEKVLEVKGLTRTYKNGLDIEGMVEIRETILRLAREKQTTFFISSHLIHEIEQVCNRLGIIMDGRLVDQCETAEVLNRTHGSLEEYYLEQVGRERRGDPS